MLRLVFMGTPDFSVPTLAALATAGHEIAAVYSQPPRPAGRGMAETKSPVQKAAEARGIEVRTPRTLKSSDEQAAFAALGADAAVVVAYGLILPQTVLATPRLGCFNLHASKLPRWRGAAPIQRAIMAGDRETAATVMRMEAGLDTGPICLEETVAITAETTAGALHDALAHSGAALMARAMALLQRGELPETPQAAAGVTYASKIEKAEARIDFALPAEQVRNHIHGLSPHPGAWFEVRLGERLERIKVLRAATGDGRGAPGIVLGDDLTIACGSGVLRPLEIQRAGKRAMPTRDALRGLTIEPGARVS